MDPIVVVPLTNQFATESSLFTFAVPAGTFSDPDVGDTLTYAGTLDTGAALPAWLTFNAATQTFSGTPPTTAAGLINLRVRATDSTGGFVDSIFVLDIANRITGTSSSTNHVGT